MVTGPMRVAGTWVRARGGYLIELAHESDPRGARRLTLWTNDVAIYELALSLEGWPTLVTATWHTEGSTRVVTHLVPWTNPYPIGASR